jgi:hypothetical protein
VRENTTERLLRCFGHWATYIHRRKVSRKLADVRPEPAQPAAVARPPRSRPHATIGPQANQRMQTRQHETASQLSGERTRRAVASCFARRTPSRPRGPAWGEKGAGNVVAGSSESVLSKEQQGKATTSGRQVRHNSSRK